jgi:ribosome-binding protein aMBF1 (putative translation factor)
MKHEYIKLKPVKINCVRKLRLYNDLDQSKVSIKTRIPESIIRSIENQRRMITEKEEEKLAELFGISVNQLYEENK